MQVRCSSWPASVALHSAQYDRKLRSGLDVLIRFLRVLITGQATNAPQVACFSVG